MELSDKNNLVSCVKWIKRGAAKANPDKIELTPEELETIITGTKAELDELEEDKEDDQESVNDGCFNNSSEIKNDINEDEFDFEHYDDEGPEESPLKIEGIYMSASTSKDLNISINNDDDSEVEDDIIRPDDNLLLIGHVEGNASTLEVYVYNEAQETLYVHHDIMLPSFPLCIEWLGIEPKSSGAPGNLCAIGFMTPVIEIWDLDIVNCIDAACKLGRKKSKKHQPVGHTDAVLDLSWNSVLHHILASGSVDQTVLLWDLDNGLPASKLTEFHGKVQCLQWHPFESQTLLTGCCDGLARVFDCRVENTFQHWKVGREIEHVIWNHFDPFNFFVGTNEGSLLYFDCRKDLPIWRVNAHSKEVTGLSLSSQCPGLLVSAGAEGSVKTWDVFGDGGNKNPVFVNEKDLRIGTLFCLDACPNSPFVFCAGGNYRSNNFEVWDLRHNNPAVEEKFSSRQLLECLTSDIEMEPSKTEPMDTTGETAKALSSLSLEKVNNKEQDSESKKKLAKLKTSKVKLKHNVKKKSKGHKFQ